MKIIISPEADKTIQHYKRFNKNKYNKIRHTIELLQNSRQSCPHYPSLNSHKMHTFPGKNSGKDMWESYIENRTPGALRMFWFYDSEKPNTIIISSITPHP